MSIVLKMGMKEVFRENLSPFTFSSNENRYLSSCYPIMNQNPSISKYRYLEVIPKLSTFSNNSDIKEKISKIETKVDVLDKILTTHFPKSVSEEKDQITQQISSMESKISLYNNQVEQSLSSDYQSFTNLIQFLTNLEKTKDPSAEPFKFTIDEYKQLTESEKQNIYEYITKYKYDVITSLNQIDKPQKETGNINSNWINIQSQQRNNANANSSNLIMRGEITGTTNMEEKYKKFRILIGVPNIPDAQIARYLNAYNLNLLSAAEKYFQSSYQSNKLTLYFSYFQTKFSFYHENDVIHHFSFVALVDELFNQVKVDCPKIGKFRLFAVNGKEILEKNTSIKCIGALNLLNNSLIKVKD